MLKFSNYSFSLNYCIPVAVCLAVAQYCPVDFKGVCASRTLKTVKTLEMS